MKTIKETIKKFYYRLLIIKDVFSRSELILVSFSENLKKCHLTSCTNVKVVETIADDIHYLLSHKK